MLATDKKYLLIFLMGSLLLIFSSNGFSQCTNVCGPNLIPNADFESYTSNCADTIGEIFYDYTSVQNWYGTEAWPCYPQPQSDCGSGSTPDYHNSNCSGSTNFEGCGGGDGAVGLFTSINVGGGGLGTVSQNREYVQIQLSSPLVAGQQYCMSMLVKSTYQSPVMVSADGIGMWLTDEKVEIGAQNGGQQFIGTGSQINAVPQVQNTPGNIIDSSCTVVSGTFCATGNEEWLVIGNFMPDDQMTAGGTGFFGTRINYMVVDNVNLQSVCTPNPQLEISDQNITCGNSTSIEVINAPSNATYEWLSPTNFSGNSGAGPFIDSPNTTTEYAVVVTTDYGCGTNYQDTLNGTVFVNCGPEITLNLLSDTICEGDCTDIEASISGGAPPYTVTWDNGIANGTGPHSICPSSTTTYTATVTDNVGDTDNATITINVGTPDSTYSLYPLCSGDDLDLYGNTITSSGMYPETFTNIFGCDSIEYNEVVVLPSSEPIHVSSTDLSDCSLTDGTITLDGLIPDSVYAISYNHNGLVGPQNNTANSNGEITITDLGEGTYSDFTITILGCSTTLSDLVSINSPNSPTADAGSDQTICENESVILTASANEDETISWNNGVSNGIPFTPSVGTQSYTLTIATSSGCTATDETTVTVNPNPTIDAGQNVLACQGNDVVLEVSGNATYTWSHNVVNGVPFSPSLGTTTYTVTAENQYGCTSSDEVDVIVSEAPTLNIITNESVGCAPFTVEFSSGATNLGDECLWDFGDGATQTGCGLISHTFEEVGCYDITLTQTLGTTNCTNTSMEEDLICVEEEPEAAFNFNPTDPSEIDSEVNFTNLSEGATNYFWTFNDSTISSEVNPTHIFPTEAGNYTVQLVASSQWGCNDTVLRTINVEEALLYYIPNTFTPDGNGHNEKFLPIMTSGFNPETYRLLIFNRWGEVIFESLNPFIGWDGTYGNEIVSDGVYIWTLEFKGRNSNERYKDRGNVNVMR